MSPIPPLLSLPIRRYTILDSIRICVRSAPVAATLYAVLEIAAAAIAPVQALFVARFIDSVIAAAQGTGAIHAVATRLAAVLGITAFVWLERAIHNISDLSLVLRAASARTSQLDPSIHL